MINDNFENRLRDGLAQQSDAIEIEGAGPSAAAARAASRNRQNSLGRAIAAVVIVAGLGAFAFAQFSGQGREDLIAAEEDDGDAPITTNPSSDLEVAAAEFASGIVAGGGESFGAFLADEGQLIQITTKPGIAFEDYPPEGPPYVVMVSDADGVIETNEFQSSVMSPLSAAYFDGVLFTVTTSPKSINGGSDVVVSASSDNGKSWTTSTIEMPPIPNPEFTSVWRDTRIAANAVGTLVSVQSNYWMDFVKLLPQYSYENGNYDIRQTETGVEVRDWTEYAARSEEQSLVCDQIFRGQQDPTDEQFEAMERCWQEMEQLPEPEPIDSYTWEELGVEPISRTGESATYFAADGKNFERVSSEQSNVSTSVVSTRSAFIAQIYPQYLESPIGESEEAEAYIYEEYVAQWIASTDGRTWDPVELPSEVCNVVGSPGDVFVAQICTESGGAYASTDNGNSWTLLADVPSEAADGLVSRANVYGGELGFVAFRTTEPDYEIIDAAFAEAQREGKTDEELAQLEEEFYNSSDQKFDVLFSEDGRSWSVLQLPAETEGQMTWGYNALVGSDQIVLTIGTSGDDQYRTSHLFLTPS